MLTLVMLTACLSMVEHVLILALFLDKWRSIFKHFLQQPSHNILFSKQASAIIHLPVREETAVPEAGHLVETFPHSHDKSLKSCQSYSPKMLLGT